MPALLFHPHPTRQAPQAFQSHMTLPGRYYSKQKPAGIGGGNGSRGLRDEWKAGVEAEESSFMPLDVAAFREAPLERLRSARGVWADRAAVPGRW